MRTSNEINTIDLDKINSLAPIESTAMQELKGKIKDRNKIHATSREPEYHGRMYKKEKKYKKSNKNRLRRNNQIDKNQFLSNNNINDKNANDENNDKYDNNNLNENITSEPDNSSRELEKFEEVLDTNHPGETMNKNKNYKKSSKKKEKTKHRLKKSILNIKDIKRHLNEALKNISEPKNSYSLTEIPNEKPEKYDQNSYNNNDISENNLDLNKNSDEIFDNANHKKNIFLI
ncbi:hypothetical protein EDEG_01723 [Edhazardia aedis USNM 41457]|uniref:Uncharacterized protein n=1 Tax=Edhazardia aedis (strain USNM 41457) TaxID=1003232 RepID=J9DN76_EDHAE|nr:hypothetical protein EDEG_01723 [Edhazardia aedis USNM 41457]|eukprot:EJW03990.1 hypothetical protein EDEG_01723 [Edhazardia aedis USNM 41457]